MKLRAPTKERILLSPVRSNLGVEAEYRKRLMTLVDAMQRSLVYWLTSAYNQNEPHAMNLAQDASPAKSLQGVMNRLSRQWNKNFREASKEIASKFADGSLKHSDVAFQKSLRKAGFNVKFQMTRPMNDAYQSVIEENVGLIRNISAQHLHDVQGMVMRSVQHGRDMKQLTEDLQKRYEITKRRAALIARDQNNKATAVMNKVRQTSLGIHKAVWSHTSASAHPRPEHESWDGEEYETEVGMYSEEDGEYVWPGTPINCGCTSRSVIPGYDED